MSGLLDLACAVLRKAPLPPSSHTCGKCTMYCAPKYSRSGTIKYPGHGPVSHPAGAAGVWDSIASLTSPTRPYGSIHYIVLRYLYLGGLASRAATMETQQRSIVQVLCLLTCLVAIIPILHRKRMSSKWITTHGSSPNCLAFPRAASVPVSSQPAPRNHRLYPLVVNNMS